MKVYLHLAESGLVKSDLSLRLYDVSGNPISISSITLTQLDTGLDYVLDNVPDAANSYAGLTLTFENPSGVYHAIRLGVAESQPSSIIIPIREVIADPITDLSIVVLQDGVEFTDLTASQLSIDGEYLISGWDSPSTHDENWSIRWLYNGQTYSIQWVGSYISGPSYYIQILARQSPFEYGKDPLNRVLFSCNYDCRAVYPVSSFIREMVKLLVENSLGVSGTNLFIGPLVEVPSGDGPYITLKQTGGFAPDESHNTKYENLGLQVIVVASDYDEGDIKAKSIYRLLDGRRNFTISI